MVFADVWQELTAACRSLDPETVFVTPNSERPFRVSSVDSTRLVASFVDSDERQTLDRDQFSVLYDRLRDDGEAIDLSDVPRGVEPYVAVLSLSPRYVYDEETDSLRESAEGEHTDTPFLRPRWEVRTPVERVHDDTLLLADMLDRLTDTDFDRVPDDQLVDLYVLLSDVQRGADDLRQAVGSTLLDHVGPSGALHGPFGTVSRTSRTVRSLKSEEDILPELDAHGVPRDWVLGVVPDKLDVVVAATDVDESAVYDLDTIEYVQKTASESARKQSRLQGIEDRVAALQSEEADALREELADLEERLDDLLAAR
ncbi:hypothetical protein [Haloarchaeobius amylolyticus]|uniref:hypothetical protein n=1 Tax=Haloarchaeobius amylolyticus TaxID=1198296 RepID=UPI0022704B77|nr:hypothetical protein [Haloarchaeobius amylolyticus]